MFIDETHHHLCFYIQKRSPPPLDAVIRKISNVPYPKTRVPIAVGFDSEKP
jgi:hypothetical protein